MNLDQQFQQAQGERDNGNYQEAIAGYEAVREQAQRDSNLGLAAECLHMIGVTYYQQDNYQQATNFYNKAVQEFLKLNKPDSVAIVQRDEALVAYKQKDFKTATELLQKSILGLDQLENKGQVGMSKAKFGVIQAAVGDSANAIETLMGAVAILEKTNDQFFLSTAYLDLAKVLRSADKTIEAQKAAENALQTLDAVSANDQFLLRRKEIQSFLKKQ